MTVQEREAVSVRICDDDAMEKKLIEGLDISPSRRAACFSARYLRNSEKACKNQAFPYPKGSVSPFVTF
jgi:hypothetical protein